MSKDIYRVISFLLVVSSCLVAQGQEWRSLGPDNLTSETRSIVYFNDGANLLAGSQTGGLWRSLTLGDSWEPVTAYYEQAMTAGGSPHVSGVAVDGSVIYVATGTGRLRIPDALTNDPAGDYRLLKDGYIGNLSGKPGAGVLVSTDNGETWQATRNATNPTAPEGEPVENPFHTSGPFSDIMTIEAKDGLVLIGTAQGLYYSTDQLATVQPVDGPEFLQTNLIFDIEFAGTDGNQKIFVSAHLEDVESEDRVFVADFSGATSPTFTELTDEALFGTGAPLDVFTIRIELAVAPSNPDIVYISAANTAGVLGVFRNNLNEPGVWTRVAERATQEFNPLGGEARDAFVLEVFPDNENELILAGQRWFTFSEENGWVQTATHGFTGSSTYIPTPIYSVAFNPNDPSQLFVGTKEAVRASFDRGLTFVGRTKGLESSTAYSVASFGFEFEAGSELDNQSFDVVVAGLSSEVVYNRNYNADQASNQGFGIIDAQDISRLEASVLYPGALLIQGGDGGIERSTNRGEVFEPFYGLPEVPGVQGLASADTFINATAAFSEENSDDVLTLTNDTSLVLLGRLVEIVDDTLSRVGSTDIFGDADSTFASAIVDTLVSPNNDTTFTDSSVTVLPGQVDITVSVRQKRRELTVQGTMLGPLRPSIPQAVWTLDEVVPPNVLEAIQADPGSANFAEYTVEELRELAPSYIFMCSGEYLWIANDGFGDLLQTRWNRLTPSLVDDDTEHFTAITVSGDTNHTVYLGTSKGNIWRVDRAHDLANFDATVNVVHLTRTFEGIFTTMRDRWITDLTVDPQNPNRLAVTYAGYGTFSASVLSSVFVTDNALETDEVPTFSPVLMQSDFESQDRLPNGRLSLSQVYSALFVAEESGSSSLLLGTERELLAINEFPDLSNNLIDGYFLSEDQVTLEISTGNVPVYDIKQRLFTSVITENALIRSVAVELPGGGTEVRDVDFDRMVLVNDNTVFAATFGRGVWASNGFQARQGRTSDSDNPLADDLQQGQIRLGPNPASASAIPTLRIAPEGNAVVTLQIFDQNGRLMTTQRHELTAGQQEVALSTFQQLGAGLYFVQAEVLEGTSDYLRTFKVLWQE